MTIIQCFKQRISSLLKEEDFAAVRDKMPKSLDQIDSISAACSYFWSLYSIASDDESLQRRVACDALGCALQISAPDVFPSIPIEDERELKKNKDWETLTSKAPIVMEKPNISENEVVCAFEHYVRCSPFTSFAVYLYSIGKSPYRVPKTLIQLDEDDNKIMFGVWQIARWNVSYPEFCAVIGRIPPAEFTHNLASII